MRTGLAAAVAVFCAAVPPPLAGGVVEIETAVPVTSVSSEELEQLPVRRDLAEIARLVPNAAGVVRFGAEPGDYSLTLPGDARDAQPGSPEAIRGASFVVGAEDVLGLRLGADGVLRDNPDPFRTSFRPPDAQVVRGCDLAYRVENQLVTVELTTPEGTIYVSAPELLPAGTSAAWTSTVVAAGATERERARNLARLEGLRLWVGNPAVLLPPGGSAQVPTNGAAQIALRDGDRTLAVGTVVLLRSPVWQGGTGGVAQPSSAALPPVFAGGALTIPGRFDGDLSNTRITVDGQPVRVVAESLFGASIYTPAGRFGRLDIVVEEGLQRGSGTFHNLGLEIAADKTDLRRGETTTCRIAVHGLAGLEQSVDLVLINRTPGVVAMAPTDRQLLEIVPGSHDAAGTLRIERRFTGIVRGRFHLQAILLPPGARLPGAPR